MSQKISTFCICLVVFLHLLPFTACPWGAATHTYFAHELTIHHDITYQAEAVYGSMLPDSFNFMFGSEYQDYLWNESHYHFDKIDTRANTIRQEAYSFGFISHNDDWGADYTAHHNSRTAPGEGYVLAKVTILMPALIDMVKPTLVSAGLSEALATVLTNQLAPSLTENFVETAIDLMIKRNEFPDVGHSMKASADFADSEIDSLLVKAYAADFAVQYGLTIAEADSIIIHAEQNFRDEITMYGDIFTKSETVAIGMLSSLAVDMSKSYIKGITGFDIAVPGEIGSEFSSFIRELVIPEIEDDYAAEISETLTYIEEQFQQHVVCVCSEPSPKPLLLTQNYPNPFNSPTTISFSLPEPGYSMVIIYNSIGQKARTLLARQLSAGSHTVVWDGCDDNGYPLSTGLYIARFLAGHNTGTLKMLLTK